MSPLRLALGLAALLAIAPLAGAQDWITVEYQVASPSPYPSNMRSEPYVVRIDGATSVRVFFEYLETEPDWDRVEIYDQYDRLVQRLSGRYSRFWSEPVQGNTLVLRMTTDWQGSARGFLVSHASYLAGHVPPPPDPQPQPQPSPSLSNITLFVRAGSRWIPLESSQALDLFVGGCDHSHFDFLVRGYDSWGNVMSRWEFDPRISFSSRGAYATLEALGSDVYRFHVGSMPVAGLRVIVTDPRYPSVQGIFYVNISPNHYCAGHGGGDEHGPGHDDGDDDHHGGGGHHEPAPRYEWQQIGSTWQQPSWVKREQDMEVYYEIPATLRTLTRFRFIPDAPTRIKFIRADFESGGSIFVIRPGNPVVLAAGQEYVFDVELPAGERAYRVSIQINSPKNSLHRAFILVPR